MPTARTETLHPDAPGLQAAPDATILARLLAAQTAATAALQPALPALARAAEAAARALSSGHRLIYAGAGSSGLMALADALELAGTFGIAPDRAPVLFAGGAQALLAMTGAVEDDPARAALDLALTNPTPGDTLLCVSASGDTPYTLTIARSAKSAGATVIGLANAPSGALLTLADIPILLDTGPELVAGSTRMAAGTAQKIALNMISTLMALRLGHVHDGQMVNLIADNAKLRARAIRVVAGIARTDADQATHALEQTDGAVKPAILIAAGAPDRATAETLLTTTGGHLGPALDTLRPLQ